MEVNDAKIHTLRTGRPLSTADCPVSAVSLLSGILHGSTSMKLITQFAQSRSLEAIYQKYGCPVRLGIRPFEDEEVRRLVCRLSLMIQHGYVGGYGITMLNAGYILERAEPLETLAYADVPVYKMRALLLLHEGNYGEARRLVDEALALYRGDLVLRRMAAWLDKEAP
jgi:hypothetical protein